jgi:hypothetical protein
MFFSDRSVIYAGVPNGTVQTLKGTGREGPVAFLGVETVEVDEASGILPV